MADDSILLELIREKLSNVSEEISNAIRAHCEDPAAHPHAHDMDVSAAVEEHLSNASAEIEAALNAESPAPENLPPPAPEPTPEAESNGGPKVDDEKPPERHHPLHSRIGGPR